MKKPFTLLVLMVLVTSSGLAREKARKSVFGASAGVSIPSLEFAKKTFRT